jgi:hypothetical protein
MVTETAGSGPVQGKRLVALLGVRALGAIALLVAGGVHLEQYTVAHFSVIPTIGALFLVNFIAATVLGVILLVPLRSTSGPWRLLLESLTGLAGVGVAAGALVALLISEQTPLFGFMEQGYRLEIVIAIASEAAAIIFLGAFLIGALRWMRRLRAVAVSREGAIRPPGSPALTEG